MGRVSKIEGVTQLEGRHIQDERGGFTNLYRAEKSEDELLFSGKEIRQVNHSYNREAGTLRGIHLQYGEYEEQKIVRCIYGSVWDVVVDLRKGSKTYGCWMDILLISRRGNGIVIPKGCGHGFQTLEDNSQLVYLHTGDYRKQLEGGVRYNDPRLGIEWPNPPKNLSLRDLNLPLLID